LEFHRLRVGLGVHDGVHFLHQDAVFTVYFGAVLILQLPPFRVLLQVFVALWAVVVHLVATVGLCRRLHVFQLVLMNHLIPLHISLVAELVVHYKSPMHRALCPHAKREETTTQNLAAKFWQKVLRKQRRRRLERVQQTGEAQGM
jgi:hypothetical protein